MSNRRITRGLLIGALLLLFLVPLYQVHARPSVQEVGQELLVNPGFEGVTRPGGWTRDTFDGIPRGEIFTPEGWVTFWRTGLPAHDPGNQVGYVQPEAQVIERRHPFLDPLRIRSGNWALKLFTFYKIHDAGYYQVVSNLPPGATVQLSAWAQGWSGQRDSPPLSDGDPQNLTFQVCIDPNGGTDPWSPNLVCSAATPSPDEYRLIGPVTAQVGPEGRVTAFLRSKVLWPYKHNDAYWDDASMVLLDSGTPPTPTPLPPPPTWTPGPPPTPLPTPTPRPDGAIVHVVQAGDTLFGIAFRYNVTVDQIKALNNIGQFIYPGQELVIALPTVSPTPSPPPPPTATVAPPAAGGGEGAEAAPPAQPQPTAVAEASGGGGPNPAAGTSNTLCVSAYNDRNGDGRREPEAENLLPQATFTLSNEGGVVATYTTDGVSEPHCFSNLSPGNYFVQMQQPAGYAMTTSDRWALALLGGTTINIEFGARAAGGEAAVTPGSTGASPAGSPKPSTSLLTRLRDLIIGASGVFVLALAVAVGVAFVSSRRR